MTGARADIIIPVGCGIRSTMSFHRRTLIQSFLPVYWFSYVLAITPFEIYTDGIKQPRMKETSFSLLKAFIAIVIIHVVFNPEKYVYDRLQELDTFTSLVDVSQMANVMIVCNIVVLVTAYKQSDLVKFIEEVVDIDLRLQELGGGVSKSASRRMFLLFFGSSLSIALFVEALDLILFKRYNANERQFKFAQMYYLSLLILNGTLTQFCCFVWILKKEIDEVNQLMVKRFALIGKIPTKILRISKTVYYKDISDLLQIHFRICNVGRQLNSIYCLVNMLLIPCYLLSFANHMYYFLRRVNQDAIVFIEYFLYVVWTVFFYAKIFWLFYMCQSTKLSVSINIVFINSKHIYVHVAVILLFLTEIIRTDICWLFYIFSGR